MSDENTCKAILSRALSELLEREEKLQPFLGEADDTKRAIGVLGKALEPKASTLKGGKATGRGGNPRAAYTEKVIEVVRNSLDPMTTGQLSLALGAPSDVYLNGILAKAKERGLLNFRDGYWELPSPIDPHEQDD